MGAWSTELLGSDSALDIVAGVQSRVLEDLVELLRLPITEHHALRASGCIGVVALLKPEWLDPFAHRGEVEEENSTIRNVLARYRFPLLRKLPSWKRAFAGLVDEVNQRLASFDEIMKRSKRGEDIEPWQPLDEKLIVGIPSVAFSDSRSASYCQLSLDRAIEVRETAPYLTDMAGLLHVAMALAPWAHVPAHTLKVWKGVAQAATKSNEEFERELAGSCREALRRLKPPIANSGKTP